MNTVKPFDPQGLAHIELGSVKLNKLVLEHNSRQIMPGGKGIRVSQNGTGVTINAVRQRMPAIQMLPFQVSVSPGRIKAEAGIFCDTAFEAIIETDPDAGLWNLQGRATIDDTTGVITSAVVEWTQTFGTDTATDFYTKIATVNVESGTPTRPDKRSINQFNYGTIYGIVHGGNSDVWDIAFF